MIPPRATRPLPPRAWGRRQTLGALLAGGAALAAPWSVPPLMAGETRVFTDFAGNSQRIPLFPRRIADAWHAHNEILVLLGAAGRICATVHSPETRPWLYRVAPPLRDALPRFGEGTLAINGEELLARGCDLVFLPPGSPVPGSLAKAGLPTLQLGFDDFAGLRRCVLATADVLGGDAPARGAAYVAYLDEKLAALGRFSADLSEAERPRVVHLGSLNPLKADGGHTIVDAWITLAGGRNAAQGLRGNMQEIGPEQLLAWDPDVIILGSQAVLQQATLRGDAFRSLSARRSGRIWVNPEGVFSWDRYSAEEALQIQWAAARLHPERYSRHFPRSDLLTETRVFYQRFFDYPLTQQEARRILAAEPPAGALAG